MNVDKKYCPEKLKNNQTLECHKNPPLEKGMIRKKKNYSGSRKKQKKKSYIPILNTTGEILTLLSEYYKEHVIKFVIF